MRIMLEMGHTNVEVAYLVMICNLIKWIAVSMEVHSTSIIFRLMEPTTLYTITS